MGKDGALVGTLIQNKEMCIRDSLSAPFYHRPFFSPYDGFLTPDSAPFPCPATRHVPCKTGSRQVCREPVLTFLSFADGIGLIDKLGGAVHVLSLIHI